jgi:hypothetical protein
MTSLLRLCSSPAVWDEVFWTCSPMLAHRSNSRALKASSERGWQLGSASLARAQAVIWSALWGSSASKRETAGTARRLLSGSPLAVSVACAASHRRASSPRYLDARLDRTA